jgi:hypothetical protein
MMGLRPPFASYYLAGDGDPYRRHTAHGEQEQIGDTPDPAAGHQRSRRQDELLMSSWFALQDSLPQKSARYAKMPDSIHFLRFLCLFAAN